MASFVTNEGASLIGAGTIVWGTGTYKARLVKSSVTPDKDNAVMTGLTAVAGTTDQTLTSLSKVKDNANDRVLYKAANPTWAAVAAGDTAGWVVIFKFGTNDADSVPIAVHDITDTPGNGGDITYDFPTVGSDNDVAFYSAQ